MSASILRKFNMLTTRIDVISSIVAWRIMFNQWLLSLWILKRQHLRRCWVSLVLSLERRLWCWTLLFRQSMQETTARRRLRLQRTLSLSEHGWLQYKILGGVVRPVRYAGARGGSWKRGRGQGIVHVIVNSSNKRVFILHISSIVGFNLPSELYHRFWLQFHPRRSSQTEL